MNRSASQTALLLLILSLFLGACSKRTQNKQSGIEVEVIYANQEEDSLLVYTFSSTNTTLRSHEYGSSFVLPDTIGTDTVLIHILYTSGGNLIMPLLPENSKGEIKINIDKQSIKAGKKSVNRDLALYAQTLSFPIISADSIVLNRFFNLVKENPNNVAAFIYNDLLKELFNQSLLADTLLGNPSKYRYTYIADRLFPLRSDILYRDDRSFIFWADNMLYPLMDNGNKGKKANLSDLWGKHRYFVITAQQSWPQDSAGMAEEKKWISLADSLQIPVVALFTNSDTIPKDLLKKRKYKSAYIPITDSTALAARIAERLYIYEEPYYMLFDSSYLARHQFTEAKELEQKLREIILKK
ncbi:MAG: hypothetical protein Q3998_05515 [Porphyromonas sp.]|nr:hypothetical protein [Porphyromonas sp.]